MKFVGRISYNLNKKYRKVSMIILKKVLKKVLKKRVIKKIKNRRKKFF